MDHHYREFMKGGEITYVGRVDSVYTYPGHNRMKLSWKKSTDPSVRYTMLYWSYQGIIDSLKIPVEQHTVVDTASATIDNLEEGDYVFNLRNLDDNGNRSLNVEKTGKVYGASYLSYIIPTTLLSAVYSDNQLQFRWQLNGDPTSLGTEIRYTSNSGVPSVYFVEPEMLEVAIADVDFNEPIRYTTLYKPDTLAIDTFYTPLQDVVLKKSQLYNTIRNDDF